MVKITIMRTLKEALVNKGNLKKAKAFKDVISVYDSSLEEVENYLSIPKHITKDVTFELLERQDASDNRKCYTIHVKVDSDKAVITSEKEDVKDSLAECTKELIDLLVRKNLLKKDDKFTSRYNVFDLNILKNHHFIDQDFKGTYRDFINNIDPNFEKIVKNLKWIAQCKKRKMVLLSSVEYDIYFLKVDETEKVTHIVTTLIIK